MAKEIKRILAVTGIRSEYFLLRPVLFSLRDQGFDVMVAVSGAHLSPWHNNTVRFIEEDNLNIVERIDSFLSTDRVTQRPKGVGLLVMGLTQTVERVDPDLILVLGDREEPLAGAIVANYMGKLCAHIGGGDTAMGNADDPVRFAVSKLSHIHFVFCQQHKENLLRVGEEEFRIFVVGNPALDEIEKIPKLDWDVVRERLSWNELEPFKYVMFLMHPLSSEYKESGFQVEKALEATIDFCRRHDLDILGIYPNTDPGASQILETIKRRISNRVRFFPTLDRDLFINLLRNTLTLVGNSSMGWLECPYLGVPVVNVGNRQKGRINAGNVQRVGLEREEILSALQRSCFDEEYRKKVMVKNEFYGNGKAGEKVISAIKSIDLEDRRWLVKERFV